MATVEQNQSTVKASAIDALTIIRQLFLAGAIVASVALGFWLFSWSQEPNYSVLFSSIDEREASIILDELQQLNVAFKLDDASGMILVATRDVHDIRIKLAAKGLPKSTTGGVAGLVGNDSPFGMSAAKEKVLFQRALEQELVRSINSLSNVQSSRIHLAIPRRSLFVRDRQRPRASVIVKLYPGRNLSEGQVSAIVHLVASSVSNLDIENVTLVDQKGHLLTKGESNSDMARTSSNYEYARRVEKGKEIRIENILAPILGADAVRAQVTADIDFTYSEQTQETYNPDTPTTRSIQTIEEMTTGSSSQGGVPGATSNQPAAKPSVPEVGAGAEKQLAGGGSSKSMRKEIKNFELDKTVSVTRFAMGRIRRLSAAVVIDDKIVIGQDGTSVRSKRSPEEIERITSLVKKAIGFDLQRGDSVNVINSSFMVPAEPAELPEAPIWEQAWVWDAVKQVAGWGFVLLIIFGVLKPVIKSLIKTIEPVMNVPALAAPSSDVADDQLTLSGAEAQQRLKGPKTPFDQNMETAKSTAGDDPKLVAQVVKTWVNSGE